VTFGLTRGEIILIAWIFALVYGAGLLPKLAARLGGSTAGSKKGKPEGE
jgi:Sec-independent protein translocase protein TatA